MRRHRQLCATRMTKRHMAGSGLAVCHAVSVGHGFKLLNPPVAWIGAHFVEGFVSLAHNLMILYVASHVNVEPNKRQRFLDWRQVGIRAPPAVFWCSGHSQIMWVDRG